MHTRIVHLSICSAQYRRNHPSSARPEPYTLDRQAWMRLVRSYRLHRDTARSNDLRAMIVFALDAAQAAASFPHAGAGQVAAGSVPARAPGSSPLPGGSLPDIQTPIKGRAVEGGDVEGDASLSAAGLPGQSGEVVGDGAHSQDVSDVTTGSDARHAEVRVGAAPTLTAFKCGWDDDGADWDPPAVFTPAQEDAIRARFERRTGT